jgi:hypothetical protein
MSHVECQHADKVDGCGKPASGRVMMYAAFHDTRFWVWVWLCQTHMPSYKRELAV